ncbi:hypothetical protein HHX47_DHR4000222 [Lentinula edodes]|nr:hypothetical protein HHX47_DHR4000222 [Lentinula edodes]
MEAENERLTGALRNAKNYVDAFAKQEEIYAAQSVIQDMSLMKMNRALRAKEKKKGSKRDNEVLPNQGLGRLWTEQGILDFQRRKKDRLSDEAAQKEQRKAKRSSKKAAKGELKAEWKNIKDKHEREVKAWTTECALLRDKGVKAKDLDFKTKDTGQKSQQIYEVLYQGALEHCIGS